MGGEKGKGWQGKEGGTGYGVTRKEGAKRGNGEGGMEWGRGIGGRKGSQGMKAVMGDGKRLARKGNELGGTGKGWYGDVVSVMEEDGKEGNGARIRVWKNGRGGDDGRDAKQGVRG